MRGSDGPDLEDNPKGGQKDDAGQTVINPTPGAGEKKGPGRPKKEPEVKADAKPSGETKKTLRGKVFQLYQLVVPFLGKEISYNEEDFTAEGESLFNLCDKFPILVSVMGWLDPLFLVLAIWDKFKKAPGKPKQKPGGDDNGAGANPA